MEFTVNEPDAVHQRLDHFLQTRLPELSRTRIQALIKEGHIRLNGSAAKPHSPLKSGDQVAVSLPDPTPVTTLPEDIPLDILFEDEHLIVVNKPAGLVVHPAAGNPAGTLVNALLHYCKNLSGIGGELRPGIVHRLDKETSGCLVAAKHDLAHTRLTQAFSERRVTKIYLAVVNGVPAAESGRIANRIGRHPVDRKRMTVLAHPNTSKEAVTEWKRLAVRQGCALIECRLLTGRTHQLRVHLRESLKTPILGDAIYAQPQRQLVPTPRLMLHAWRLGFDHPINGTPLSFEARIPKEFEPWLP